jgi:hypothetical protein
MRNKDDSCTVELENHCKRIAKEIELGQEDYYERFEYYDVEYILDSQLQFKGADVMVAGGGPALWINTKDKKVRGYWWGSTASWEFIDNVDLAGYMEESYENLR